MRPSPAGPPHGEPIPRHPRVPARGVVRPPVRAPGRAAIGSRSSEGRCAMPVRAVILGGVRMTMGEVE
ncbi:hypothetical protein HKX69_22610 [Streptomyces argyrophyllae]|uniref:Uncharacterized protein n=1 Tax=Streptomyces argyrophylli TaxID=2726118 RepID=A0A6M4PMU4_9ACTN|nr:hypothetical protein HKX69_22610 [Streptomyces argyrophyllae]